MQTYLIVAKDKEVIRKKITEIINSLNIKAWNLHQFNPDPSFGIEATRRIKELVSLKPYTGGYSAVVINDLQKGTVEAQNAMLKILEEPPENTFFILTTDTLYKILPTIVSRCQIVKMEKKVTSPTLEKEEEIFWKILKATSGERIIIADEVGKSREETLLFLTKITSVLQKYLSQPPRALHFTLSQIAEMIKKVEKARTTIEKNVNYKATSDLLFLGFPKV